MTVWRTYSRFPEFALLKGSRHTLEKNSLTTNSETVLRTNEMYCSGSNGNGSNRTKMATQQKFFHYYRLTALGI